MSDVEPHVDEWQTIALAIDSESHVAWLTLNRPRAMNAISRQMAADLQDACARLRREHAVRAVVMTGAGERAFCAGADLKERRGLSAEERAAHTTAIEHAAEAVADLPTPTSAASRGFALAGGAELAIACDLRVAASDAERGFPEVRIGIFPGAGGVLRLPRLVGRGAARDLLFTGRRVDAPGAYRIGLVDRVVAPEATEQTAHDLALSIAANAPLAVRAVKEALAASDATPIAEARAAVNGLRAALDATADYEEGLAAPAERRAPRFSGR
jgi:enoyl-CoA hydratase/carnithine racemase